MTKAIPVFGWRFLSNVEIDSPLPMRRCQQWETDSGDREGVDFDTSDSFRMD